MGAAISCHPFRPRSSTHNGTRIRLLTCRKTFIREHFKRHHLPSMYNHKNIAKVHYIHTSYSSGLYTDIADTVEQVGQVVNRRVTASRLDLTFHFNNIQAPSFHFSTLLQHLQSFLVSRNRYRKNSLVVTVHTSARNVFRKGLPTHKPLTLRLLMSYIY